MVNKMVKKKKDSYKAPFWIVVVFSLFLLAEPYLDVPHQTTLVDDSDDYKLFDLTGGSMRTLKTGPITSGVAIKVDKEDIALGNVLVYKPQYGDKYVYHRVVKIEGDTYYMKGDTSDDYDLIEYDDVSYKLVAVVN